MGNTKKTLSKCPKCKVRIPPGTKLKPYCEKCGFTFPVDKEPMSLKGLGIVGGILGVVLLAALAFFFWPKPKEVRVVTAPFKSFLNAQPTELSTDSTWIRVADKTNLASLKGQVVWLEFTTVQSAGSSEKEGYLNRWANSFGSDGLSIVTVFSGPEEKKVGSDLSNLRTLFKGKRTKQLVMFDPNGTTASAYGVTRFPCSYLINKEGVVVWEGKNNENLTSAEAKIKEEVAK